MSSDSKIPFILIASGWFKQISTSWTLVPYFLESGVSPSFKVPFPVPEISSTEFDIIVKSLFIFLLVKFIDDLDIVAINLALVAEVFDNDLKVIVLESPLITTFWEFKGSVSPSEYNKMYLSIVYGKNARDWSPLETDADPEATVIFSNSLRILMVELLLFTLDIKFSGSDAKNPGSLETSNCGYTIETSVIVISDDGKIELLTPTVAVIWDTVIWLPFIFLESIFK